jgi:hypothetical protein
MLGMSSIKRSAHALYDLKYKAGFGLSVLLDGRDFLSVRLPTDSFDCRSQASANAKKELYSLE